MNVRKYLQTLHRPTASIGSTAAARIWQKHRSRHTFSLVTEPSEQNFLSSAFISTAKVWIIAVLTTDAMRWRD